MTQTKARDEFSEKGPLSTQQLECFHRDGYLVVSNVLDKAWCREFLDHSVQSCIDSYGTLRGQHNKHLATGDYDPQKHTEIPGVMIRNRDWSDPLPDHGQEHILQNKNLVAILDQLHGGKESWEWIHPQNVGWIHVRLHVTDATQFEPRWHVDGAHFTPHYVDSSDQSVVVLPILHDVGLNGGSTLVLPSSHHYMAQLMKSKVHGLKKSFTQDCRPLAQAWSSTEQQQLAPVECGDVVFLHPLLVHAAGFHTDPAARNRITFNLGTKWTRPLCLEQPSSWLESSLKHSLSEPVVKLAVKPTCWQLIS